MLLVFLLLSVYLHKLNSVEEFLCVWLQNDWETSSFHYKCFKIQTKILEAVSITHNCFSEIVVILIELNFVCVVVACV